MQDETPFAFLGLHPAEALPRLHASSRTPTAGDNIVPLLPRRARSCSPGVAAGPRGVIVLFPRRGDLVVPQIVTKDV